MDYLAYPAPVWASWLSWPLTPGRRSDGGTWWSHWWNKEIMEDVNCCPFFSRTAISKCPEPHRSPPVSPLATCLGRCCWHHHEWWVASWSWRPCGEAAESCWPGCGVAVHIQPQLPACWTPLRSSSSCSQREVNGCSPGWWFSTSDGKSSLSKNSGPVATDDDTPSFNYFSRITCNQVDFSFYKTSISSFTCLLFKHSTAFMLFWKRLQTSRLS